MSLLPLHWQAKLRWWLRWSEGDLAFALRSNFGAVLAAQLDAKLRAPGYADPRDSRHASMNTVLITKPTRVRTSFDYEEAMFRAFDTVAEERRIRQAVGGMPKELGEVLVLAYGVERMPSRDAFGTWGNLADRTQAAHDAWRKSRSRLMLNAFLDKLAQRSTARPAPGEKPDAQGIADARSVARECEVLAAKAAASFMKGIRHA